MAIETDFKSLRKDLQRVKGIKQTSGVLGFEDALELVRTEVGKKLTTEMDEKKEETKEDATIKDKKYLRKRKEEYKKRIESIVYGQNIKVRGYERKIELFIEEMVEEFSGYSILADAQNNPGVSDIFCLKWNKIYVEKNGVNVKYHKTFRSAEHYKAFVDRLVRESGNEINNGNKKIVNFELYGDRYTATSKAVSPKDFSLTIRKHKEDQLQLKDIIAFNVMSQEIADLLGTIILGECNVIYGGLTGSGKTTSIRALLDHYVSQANKRMLVCEDTQELFPKNDHTLELVSVRNDDPKLEITLQEIIYTALRLKPKYICVGEVRGLEAESAVEAMETGHSTIFTMHGGKPMNIVNRLVTKYLSAMPTLGIDVVERIIGSAVDYIVLQDDIPGIGRKVTSITEVSFDFEKGRVALKTIFEYDFLKEDFVMVSKISQEKAKNMLRRGVKIETLKPLVEGWSEELKIA
ncbi:ATPase, T2SS/T4P/T4SS family [Bacillus cereus group sp. BfR-BA-01363]|uniref:CpaF family protein n=1 Tax=Bacillus cereus group sp. BfR-BA-01363 TaxID=3094882 RepID=UPI0029C508AA|nr:ATPase, T2SS/T4P/T4SS family [Bacillus cereus group sp. BfR-BA-01363]MDX5853088.1 ATPase, T2SS/T4P/T4SS family [Bacillus cereus group sp. BfR-BA-01363]